MPLQCHYPLNLGCVHHRLGFLCLPSGGRLGIGSGAVTTQTCSSTRRTELGTGADANSLRSVSASGRGSPRALGRGKSGGRPEPQLHNLCTRVQRQLSAAVLGVLTNESINDDFTQAFHGNLLRFGSDEYIETVVLSPCSSGDVCGGADLPDYSFTYRVTRLPDARVGLRSVLDEAMRRSGVRSELEAIVSGLRSLRAPSPRKIEPETVR
jgi:hypothetical protein